MYWANCLISTAPDCPSVNIMHHYTSTRHSHTLKVRPRPLPSLFVTYSLDLQSSDQSLGLLITDAHCSLSIPCSRHILNFIFRRSFSTTSNHLSLGIPIALFLQFYFQIMLYPSTFRSYQVSYAFPMQYSRVLSMPATVSKSLYKTRVTLKQVMKTQKNGYRSTFFQPRHQMGVGVQSHDLAALPPRKRPGTLCTGCRQGPRDGLDC